MAEQLQDCGRAGAEAALPGISRPGPAPSIQTTNASPGACRQFQVYARVPMLSAQLKACMLLTKPFLVFTAAASEDNNVHFEELIDVKGGS